MAIPISSTPLTNTSSGTTTNSGVQQSPPAPLDFKQPIQNASYPMSVTPKPAAPAPTPVVQKAPAVITAKPAIKQAQSQIADVSAMSKQVADLTKPGGSYTAATGSDLQKQVQAMSAAAGGTKTTTPTPTTPTTPTSSSTPAPVSSTPSATGYGTGVKSSEIPNGDATGWSLTGRDAEGNSLWSPPKTDGSGTDTSTKSDADLLQDNVDQTQRAIDENNKKIDQIMNGTFPLTDEQRAQLDGIRSQYDALISQQRQINQSYENSVRMAGVSAGRNMYAPEVELGNIGAAVSAGLSRISELNNAMNDALMAAKAGIKQDNMKLLDMQYQRLKDTAAQRNQAIKDLHQMNREAIEDAQKQFTTMQADLKDMAAAKRDPSSFDPGFFDKIDKQRAKLGLPTYEGYTKDVYKLQYNENVKKTRNEDEKTQLDRAKSLIDIFDKTGTKGDITIGDHTYTYQGTNSNDIATGTETDVKTGKLMLWKLNVKTGEKQLYDTGINMSTGKKTVIDVGGLKYAYDETTNEATPIFVSGGQESWDDGQFATGKTGPALPGSPNAGQCGAMNNYFYGKGVVGDSLESKLNPLKPYAVDFSVKDTANIRPGMSFVQDIGTNGHIGIVEGVGVDPVSKKGYITVFESNYHSDGKISHGRQIFLDNPTLKMISNYPAPNLPAFGPDAPPKKQLGDGVTDKKTLLSVSEAKELGVPFGTTIDDAAKLGKTPKATDKPPTADQEKNAGFAMRMQESMGIFDSLESKITGMGTAEQLYQRGAPNFMKSAEMQQQEQAERNFINSVLRRESGAAISDTEFESARKQYFPQPGDKPEVLQNKKQNRETALRSMVMSSGPALSDDFGTKSTPPKSQDDVEEVPAYVPSVINDERRKGTPDDQILSFFTEHMPTYKTIIDQAKKNGKSSTEILNALMK